MSVGVFDHVINVTCAVNCEVSSVVSGVAMWGCVCDDSSVVSEWVGALVGFTNDSVDAPVDL